MNNAILHLNFRKLATLAVVVGLSLCISVTAWAQTNSRGEEFFIISSVNFQNHQIVLMRPTQLTVVATFDPETTVLGEKGEKLTTKDLKAGDTVWGMLKFAKDGSASVLRLREGAMTQSDLRNLYLRYPANGVPNAPMTPLTPRTQSGAADPQPATPAGTAPNAFAPNPIARGAQRPNHARIHPHGPGSPVSR